MIKPARNQREESVEWSIDANVSLVDLGLTLHKWLGFEPEKRSKFEIVSLEETVLRPASGWRKSRAVISESGWSDWRRLGPVRFAIRSDHYLFLNDRQPRLFNSLIDRSESNPVVNPEIQYAPIFSNFKRLAERENWPSWQTSSPIEVEKYYLAARIFSEKEISPQNLLRISILSRNPQHGLEIMGWLARFYLERRDWDRLLDLGVEAKNQNWIYLTRRLKNLSLGTSASSCLGQLVEKKTPVSGCDDELYRKFFDYVSAGRGERAEAGERFFQSYLQRKIDEKIAVANLRNGLMWDVRIELLKEPHLVDLALWLPEFKSQKIWLDRRMSRQTIL